jgi:hypothetical protein
MCSRQIDRQTDRHIHTHRGGEEDMSPETLKLFFCVLKK